MLSRLLRRLAATSLLALVVSAALAWHDAAGEGWIALGWWRLVAVRLWHHADRWLPALAAAAIAATLVERAVRRRPFEPRGARLALAVVLAVAGLRVAELVGLPRPPARPNLVLVSIDTLRADRVGAYGYPRPTTPRLDARLAAEGVVFENVVSQSPKTTPSHMTMLTSLYPCVHGVLMWEGNEARAVLSPRANTLAEVLAAAGYATAGFTAGGPMDRSRGFADGFALFKQGHQLERALAWLERRPRGRPFFLFLHSYDVHDPYVPPPAQVERFLSGYHGPVVDAVARIRAGVGGWERAHRTFWDAVDANDPAAVAAVSGLYDGVIRQMDETTLAPLLDRLDALGLARDTLVVFTSDHGEAFGEHGRFLHDDLYLPTLRVPFVLRLPGRLRAGARVAAPMRLLDVMPTLLDLLGVPAPPDLQGRSLAALARGLGPEPPRVPIVSEHDAPGGAAAYHGVRLDGATLLEEGGSRRLYDLAADPGERHDVAAEQPGLAGSLHAELERWWTECARLGAVYGPRGPGALPSADALRKLRALGYVE